MPPLAIPAVSIARYANALVERKETGDLTLERLLYIRLDVLLVATGWDDGGEVSRVWRPHCVQEHQQRSLKATVSVIPPPYQRCDKALH